MKMFWVAVTALFMGAVFAVSYAVFLGVTGGEELTNDECGKYFCFTHPPVLLYRNGTQVQHCTMSQPYEDCFVYHRMTPEEQRQQYPDNRTAEG